MRRSLWFAPLAVSAAILVAPQADTCTTSPCVVSGAAVCSAEFVTASPQASPFSVATGFVINNASVGCTCTAGCCAGGSLTFSSITALESDSFNDATGTSFIPGTPFGIPPGSSLLGSFQANFPANAPDGLRHFVATLTATNSAGGGPVIAMCAVDVMLESSFKMEMLGGLAGGYLAGTQADKTFRITNLTAVARNVSWTITSTQTSSSTTADHYPMSLCGNPVPPGNSASTVQPTLTGVASLPASIGAFVDVCFSTKSYSACHSCSNNKYVITGNDGGGNSGLARWDYTVLGCGWGGYAITGSTAPPSTTTTNFSGLGGAIPDVTTSTFTRVVSGVGTTLYDVDLTTNITHTFAADLDITLTSPTGKQVSITTDNGGGNDDVFNGTFWDDLAPSAPTKYAYVNSVVAAALTPEGAFRNLRGLDPNGTWTLTITDDATGDVGNLSGWSLAITTANGPIPVLGSPVTFSSSPGLSITDFATVNDTIAVGGSAPALADVRVYTEITHTFAADIDMFLTSPAGTVVQLTKDNGAGADNVFNGTLWRDDARSLTVDFAASNFAYTNLVPAPQLSPDGSLLRFAGENPNGVWTLSIFDDATGDVGTLARWDLLLYEANNPCNGAGASATSYCTSGTTSQGCVAVMTSVGTPSKSAAVGFFISALNVPGATNGLIFYGISGQLATPWGLGSTSFLCVKAPTQRTCLQNSGGTSGQCDGTYSLDWHAFMTANSGALGNPRMLGQVYDAQAWFRDPPAPKTTGLSNGLEFVLGP